MPNTNDRLKSLEKQFALYKDLTETLKLNDKVKDLEKEIAVLKEKNENLEKKIADIQQVSNQQVDVVKAINKIPSEMSRVLKRYHQPLSNDDVEEDDMEMVDYNYRNGMKWKSNVMAVFPSTPENELETKVDAIRKQHRKEFPNSYNK